MNNDNIQTPNRTTRNIVLAILAVTLLAVAAYVGGGLIRKQKTASEKGDFQIVAAEGLPDAPFELIGSVSSREGNSLFVETKGMNEALGLIGGKGGVDKKDSNENTSPPTEIVISRETVLYRDSTWDAYISGEADKDDLRGNQIQQEIVPGSAEELGPGSSVTVWGERNGDRVVAEFVLYSLPFPADDKKITK
jgi:hypothetical protein